MSKKRGNQPTPGELGFVQQVLLKGDPPLYSKWVTKRKRDKVQDRLIVVGKYRVFSIKKTLTGKKQVQRVGHLYDMVAINSPDIDRVIMKFKDFDIDVQEPGAGTELIAVIRQAFQKISCGFAEYATPKITLLPAERQLQPLPEIDYGIGNGILATYEAFCDYYKLPPSQEFMKYVTDVVNSGSRELIMEQCPGVDRKENPINFTPIRAALRHNTYFAGFVLRSIPRKEVGLCIADSLMHNVTLEKLIISGVETPDSAFQAIGTAMRKNQYNRIVHIDFSNTPTLKDKGCVGLADGLMATTHGITNLNLAACNIGVKGIQALFQSLCLGNSQVGRELMELDLSYNNINQIGSISMANYFNQEGCGNKLQYLLLSHTKLDVSVITKSLKGGQITTIVELDLSGNKIDAPAGQSLASVIESSQYLQTLNVSSCGLLPPTATAIVSAVASNQYLQSVSINISANELGPVGAQSISQVIANCNNIATLVMANCGFKKEGMLKLAEAIGQNNCLKGLDISYNLHTGTSSKMLKVVQALAQAVQRHPTLQHFAIQGDSNKFAVGAELKPLFDCIAQNPTLTELDITGNKIGDQLAVALCDSLRSNNHLKSLLWDKNNVNIGGWQALVNVLGQNRTLISNPPPVYDIDKAIKDSKNKEVFAQRLKEVIDNIQSALKQNSGGQSTAYTSEFEKAKRGRTYTVKPAYQTLRRTQDAPSSPSPTPSAHQSYDYSQSTGFAPPPPPPAYYTDNSYGSYDQSYQEPTNDNYYDAPPPPPERDAYTEEHAYSYEQEYAGEFDDTQYEAAPPPPPPPPF